MLFRSGEIASSLAIHEISRLEKISLNTRNFETTVTNTFIEINNLMAQQMKANRDLRGMGTTLTAVFISKESVYLAHLGDSRAYLIRNGKITQLSKDHTVIQELLDQGRINPDEVDGHPQRSLITKALMGSDQHERPDIVELDFNDDDFLLLCSDGLTEIGRAHV